MDKIRKLAFDFGASNGRAILGTFDGNRIVTEEIHRFPNDPVIIRDRFYWDIVRLFHEIKQQAERLLWIRRICTNMPRRIPACGRKQSERLA